MCLVCQFQQEVLQIFSEYPFRVSHCYRVMPSTGGWNCSHHYQSRNHLAFHSSCTGISWLRLDGRLLSGRVADGAAGQFRPSDPHICSGCPHFLALPPCRSLSPCSLVSQIPGPGMRALDSPLASVASHHSQPGHPGASPPRTRRKLDLHSCRRFTDLA